MTEQKTVWLVDASDAHAVNAVMKLAGEKKNHEVVPLTGPEFAAWQSGKIQRVVLD